jgi:hypothetical protein
MLRTLRSHIVVGRHQIAALALLGCFAFMCWKVAPRVPFTQAEQDHIWAGRQQIEAGVQPRTFRHTPLVNLMSAAPMQLDADRVLRREPTPEHIRSEVRRLRWILRIPFILCGIFLGVSVWYVARRLYGNAGGYVALALYCFSPAMVFYAASIDEAVPSAWGIFGIIFGAIAISHNLYAPWRKWRYRTVLLSVATALAIASHPAAILLVPLAFAFMVYLAPGRRWAVFIVAVVTLLVAATLVYAAYNFQPRALLNGIDLRDWLAYTPAQARAALVGDGKAFMLRFNPAVLFGLIISVITYVAWRRTRYFGNTAPVIVGAALLYFALISPLALTASIWALPFLFVFTGGIWADLLETKGSKWILAAVLILLIENAWYCWIVVRMTATSGAF